MAYEVMLAVLFSALLHAGWNALLRAAPDKRLGSLLVAAGAALWSMPWLWLLPAPEAASRVWLVASALIHVLYFRLLSLAYRHTDLSLAYPVMRGAAPLLAALAALLWLHEQPGLGGWTGIGLIASGVLLLALGRLPWAGWHASGLAWALGNALVIALYTVLDGHGARLSGHALAYTAWQFVLTAVLMLGWGAVTQTPRLPRLQAWHWRVALLGGGASLAAYSLVLWAMTQAPIARVAALRETSIVFAALLGWWLLGERLSRQRLLAIAVVLSGAALLRLA
ncbi:MAG: SMR family transporter [Hylemonella sp.]|nr:SMR family transporter [Hylemonella sp.]MDH5707970.1 SMR family transporter [Hylemonella sp.]